MIVRMKTVTTAAEKSVMIVALRARASAEVVRDNGLTNLAGNKCDSACMLKFVFIGHRIHGNSKGQRHTTCAKKRLGEGNRRPIWNRDEGLGD